MTEQEKKGLWASYGINNEIEEIEFVAGFKEGYQEKLYEIDNKTTGETVKMGSEWAMETYRSLCEEKGEKVIIYQVWPKENIHVFGR